MIKIIIQLEFNQGPIWPNISDPYSWETSTGVPSVDNDSLLWEINNQIQNMYMEYFEFDSHGEACWINKEKMHNEKEEMLYLINKLKDRLNEINDGSFEIEDRETSEVMKW